eukprot:3874664-Pyramimonas_sp.AAC.1
MFVADKDAPHAYYPTLSKAVKAAETRALATVCYQLAQDYDTGSNIMKTRTLLFKSLCQVYHIIDVGDMFLTDTQCTTLQRSGDNYLTCYSALARHALEQGKKKWFM